MKVDRSDWICGEISRLVKATRVGAIVCTAAISILFATAIKADSFAYDLNNSATSPGTTVFGVLDLNTGVFASIGTTGTQDLFAGLGVANGELFGANFGGDGGVGLDQINTTTGAITQIAGANISYGALGSTTTGGLYALDDPANRAVTNLYSVNPVTGATTLIGSTGLSYVGTGDTLSNGSGTLYFADGTNLYTLNTSTGAATLVGSTGGAQFGGLVFETGALNGGEISPNSELDTLNTSTGAATAGAAITGMGSGYVTYGLAEDPLPPPQSGAPEPSSWILLGTGLITMVLRRRL